jgi:hypothetical protein
VQQPVLPPVQPQQHGHRDVQQPDMRPIRY